MYLSGTFGTRPTDVNAYAASSFYAVDRYASYMTGWKGFYEKSDSVVLATRYTSSNEIHQLAKLERDDWDAFIRWAEDYEYEKLGIPRPDAVLYLDMDIHELDTAYMERCHKAAAYAADRLGWHSIMCYEGREPLSKEEIAAKILEKVTRLLDMSEEEG